MINTIKTKTILFLLITGLITANAIASLNAPGSWGRGTRTYLNYTDMQNETGLRNGSISNITWIGFAPEKVNGTLQPCPLSAENNATLCYNQTTNNLTVSYNGSIRYRIIDNRTGFAELSANNTFTGTGITSFRDTTGNAQIEIEGGASGVGDNATINFVKSGLFNWLMGLDSSDGNKFKLVSNTFDSPTIIGITVDSSGNLGVGKTSPTTKLDVAGTINATSLRGNGSGLSGLNVSNITGLPPSVQKTNTSLARGLNTVYQNTNSTAKFVQIGTTQNGVSRTLKTDSSNPPTIVVAEVDVNTGAYQYVLTAWVLPDNYYMLSGTTAVINSWTEWN